MLGSGLKMSKKAIVCSLDYSRAPESRDEEDRLQLENLVIEGAQVAPHRPLRRSPNEAVTSARISHIVLLLIRYWLRSSQIRPR